MNVRFQDPPPGQTVKVRSDELVLLARLYESGAATRTGEADLP